MLETPDVDAKLERRGGHGGEVRVLVAHELLGRLPKARGEVAVMDEKAVRLPHRLAVLAKRCRHGLALLA